MTCKNVCCFAAKPIKKQSSPPGWKYAWLLFSLVGLLYLFCIPAYAVNLLNIEPLFEITNQLNKPVDVSVSEQGLIYIVDGVNNKVRVFNPKGTLLFSFGKKGSGQGEFGSPLGLDVDSSGRVYIADSANHRVEIFNSEGAYLAEIKISAHNTHEADPTDVVVDNSNNRCYVVDNDNHRVLVYDLTKHNLVQIYGRHGAGRDRFRYPFLAALGNEGRLYVVDVINTRVQVLNSEGSFVAEIGGWGVEKGEFFRPKGVAVDSQNRLYVSDSYMGVVQVFEADGEFYAVLGEPQGGKVKKFRTPTGMFIDTEDRLYVVEALANKVSVYRLKDLTR
jgi:DNA-binding beta-propeller fold protein YncE